MNYRARYANGGYRPTSGYRIGAYGDGSVNATPPGLPFIWFDAQNIDGVNNATLVDGQGVATWKNLGSLGSTADLTQGTSAAQPLFRAVATPGKLNNRSAVESSADRYIGSGLTGNIAQPNTYFAVIRAKSSQAGLGGITGIVSGPNQWGLVSLQHRLYAGTIVTTSQSVTLNTWHTCAAVFNSTSSFTRQDGAQSANVDCNTGALNGIFLMAGGSASQILDGFIAELIGYTGTAPAATAVEAYLAAKYGTTPQT